MTDGQYIGIIGVVSIWGCTLMFIIADTRDKIIEAITDLKPKDEAKS